MSFTNKLLTRYVCFWPKMRKFRRTHNSNATSPWHKSLRGPNGEKKNSRFCAFFRIEQLRSNWIFTPKIGQIGIFIKIVKLSFKWYSTCYDYLWHGSAMLQNVEQGQRWKAAKWLKFCKSFKVCKSEFDHLLLLYASKSLCMFNIIKIVKLFLKWYLPCYDYILYWKCSALKDGIKSNWKV